MWELSDTSKRSERTNLRRMRANILSGLRKMSIEKLLHGFENDFFMCKQKTHHHQPQITKSCCIKTKGFPAESVWKPSKGLRASHFNHLGTRELNPHRLRHGVRYTQDVKLGSVTDQLHSIKQSCLLGLGVLIGKQEKVTGSWSYWKHEVICYYICLLFSPSSCVIYLAKHGPWTQVLTGTCA